MTRAEMSKQLLAYFQELGRVPVRSEYIALGDNAPIHYRIVIRTLGPWNTAMKRIKFKDPAGWAKIYDMSDVYTKDEQPKPVLEPASDEDLSPLEKLRSKVGESSE